MAKNGNLGFDGKRLIAGAQDQGLITYGFKILVGLTTNDQCRFCYNGQCRFCHNGVISVNHLI